MLQSVIVSTYNKPFYLERVLEGLKFQDRSDFEVIVADDGSTDETRELIARRREQVSFPLEHVWQEDLGFRAARIRNLGLKAARGEQVIFLDGDCVPFPEFLSAHARAYSPETFLAGDRLFLDESTTMALAVGDVADGQVRTVVPSREYRSQRVRIVKDSYYRATRLKQRPKVVTANVSAARAALEMINGLDERFVGWGHEDEDLRRRLIKAGYRVRSIAGRAQVAHLWHPTVDSFQGRVKFGVNAEYYHRGFYLSRCRLGLETRAMSDLSIVWGDDPSPARDCEVGIGWPGSPPRVGKAEVSIYYCPTREKSHPHCDLLIEPGSRVHWKPCSRKQPSRLEIDRPLDLSQAEDRDRLLGYLDPIL